MNEQAKQAIIEQFHIWNRALATGDAEQVARLYGPDAVLLPTVSNRIRSDHAGIKDYFEHFLTKQPQGELEESHVRRYGELAIHSGAYLFTMGATGDKVRARFTFIYRETADGWHIIEHHSSAMPEG